MTLPSPQGPVTVQWYTSIEQIDQAAWDTLALPLESPFLEWEWLRLAETSGSAIPETGWMPHHLTLWSGERLVAAAPLYVKSNSTGEFVYDQIWAEVAGRLGLGYYPKLVGMSPFTPTGAYRFLTARDMDESLLTGRLVREVERLCEDRRLSGASFLFVDPVWAELMAGFSYRAWVHQGYLWTNQGYGSLDDFLAEFGASQRRNVRRERRDLRQAGIRVVVHEGRAITPELMRTMYRLYVKHNEQFGPWSCRFLSQAFFDGLTGPFLDRLLLVEARRDDRPGATVAMALLVTKGDSLYGRYWGCFEEVRYLHFEVCYYSPLEWAVAHGIRRFDPGVGGYHKVRRGFRAVPIISLHRFMHPGLRLVMEANMDEINAMEMARLAEINGKLPFVQAR